MAEHQTSEQLTQWQPGMGGPAQFDNVPSDPPDDNSDARDEQYQPQSTDGLQNFEGYGQVGYQDSSLPPPPPLALPDQTPPKIEFGTGVMISDSEAREALLAFVAEHCCYGKGAAEKAVINGIKPSDALHYKVETFCESRSTVRVEVPYRGGVIDGPFNGRPPFPWDVPCHPSQLFFDETKRVPVPHTDEVRGCGKCFARGFIRCYRCQGGGRIRCMSCNGIGRHFRYREGIEFEELCHPCGGSGRRVCLQCGGDGRIICNHCDGFGKVRNYIQLTVHFVNHVGDFILEETDMPDQLVREVTGVMLFEQTLLQVPPVVGFPIQAINDNSVRLLEGHKMAFRSERQLQQRHTLQAVPVSEVAYTWKEEPLRFWVYGDQRRVYAPDYPQQCCWGCSVM